MCERNYLVSSLLLSPIIEVPALERLYPFQYSFNFALQATEAEMETCNESYRTLQNLCNTVRHEPRSC